MHYIHADTGRELVATHDEANRLCRLIGEIMHAEAEAAEAIPNPMIGRRRRQFFVPDQYLDLRTISGSFCTTYFKVEQQINPVLEILFIFCTRCHRWRAYRVAKCCRVLGQPEILIFSSSHPLQSLYIFGERMSNNLAPDTQRPSDRQGNPDGVNATFFAHAVSTGRILRIISFSANWSQLSLAHCDRFKASVISVLLSH